MVRTIDGERRQIDSFDALIVEARACEAPGCREQIAKFVPPLRIEQTGGALRVIATNREQTFDHRLIDRMHVRELSPGRTAIVAGVAIGLGLAAGVLTYRAVGCEKSSDEGETSSGFGCAGFVLGMSAAGAAGSLSLLVTLPLTKPLGRSAD